MKQVETAEATDDFEALLRSVESQRKRVRADERRAGTGSAEAPSGGEVRSRNEGEAALSSLEVASIQRQISGCWNLVGVDVAERVVVPLRVILNPDGSVQRVDIQDRARFASDARYQAIALNAQRAVLGCRLSLPPEKYAAWKDIVLNFDPYAALSG